MNFDKASNAVVAVVGFYADALAVLDAQVKNLTQQLQAISKRLHTVLQEDQEARVCLDQIRELGDIPDQYPNISDEVVLGAIRKVMHDYDHGTPVGDMATTIRTTHQGPIPTTDVRSRGGSGAPEVAG